MATNEILSENKTLQPVNPFKPTYDPLNPSVMPKNLDITNRQAIMDAYGKYRQGQPMGPHTADVRSGVMFMGQELPGQSSTSLGNFRDFLKNYGIEDKMTFPNLLLKGSLGTVDEGGLTPTQPSQPIPPQMTPPPGGIQPIPQTPIVKGGDFVENMNQKNPFSQQLTGFGETLGGYGKQLGGFGEQLGGFENKMTGFNEQFSNINNKLQNMEKGISSLTDKINNQQQTQSSQPYSNPYGGLQSMLFGSYGGYQSPFTNYYSFY